MVVKEPLGYTSQNLALGNWEDLPLGVQAPPHPATWPSSLGMASPPGTQGPGSPGLWAAATPMAAAPSPSILYSFNQGSRQGDTFLPFWNMELETQTWKGVCQDSGRWEVLLHPPSSHIKGRSSYGLLLFSYHVVWTPCDPMVNSMPDFPVLHCAPEPAQTHVHWASDAIQPSHSLSPLLLLPSIFLSIRVFSKESIPHIRWPKYWSFSPSNKYSGLISFRID